MLITFCSLLLALFKLCIGLLSICSAFPASKFPGVPGNHRGPFTVRREVLSKEHTLLCRGPPAASQLPCSPLEMKQWGALSSGNAAPLWDPLGLAQPALTAYLSPQE